MITLNGLGGGEIYPVNGQCPGGLAPIATPSDGTICLPPDWVDRTDPFTSACPAGTVVKPFPPPYPAGIANYCGKPSAFGGLFDSLPSWAPYAGGALLIVFLLKRK